MPGDTVRIRSGTYTGWSNQLNPTRSGRADAWITFRADDGALPIIEPTSDITAGSGFEPVDVAVSYIRVEGLVARNWPTSGFSNGWNHPSSNIQIRYCIAENNGTNGITFYKASNVLFEYNIAAHNGNRAPSWSSGVNRFGVGFDEHRSRQRLVREHRHLRRPGRRLRSRDQHRRQRLHPR
jgi:hypothetical protein